MNKNYTDEELVEFLQNSNWIEEEYGSQAVEDAMQAWDYIMMIDELTIEHVLEVHRRLMETLNPRIAGKLRDVAVYVGGREGAKHYAVPELLGNVVTAMNEDIQDGRLMKRDGTDIIKHRHVQFEHIHPFEDGNGRTGRILMNWQRLKMGLPLLIIHEGEEQFDYYRWFRE